ncbi:hypothetical protein V1264_006071 [Littorina saxatilis]|uniref:HECT domain-containing protein n=2 Tax=Littorina saxatilis TaxID=31220 RepID=A0AAN9G5B6_9CAEN
MLAKSGLGAKKIQLLQHDTSEEVYKKLQNAYPALNGCGGFELMRAQGHGRSLVAINPCYAVSNLKSSGSQGTFYIRPVQQDLILQQSLENDQEIKVKEACLKCGRMYDLTALRGHHAACQPAAHGNEEIQSVMAVVIDPQDSDVVVLPGEEDDTDTDLPDLAAAASDVLLGEEDDTDTDLPEPLFAAAASLSEEDLLENVIKECISICQDDNVTNPIEILRVAQRKIVTGRKLDIDASAMTTGLTGNTNFISIDRDSVVDSAFDALADVPLKDLRLCLEVNFIGEKASDYGGPRKEFFQSVLLAIKETFFDNIRPQSEHYETIGKIMALSTLQNGRLPRIMTPELCEEVFKTPTNETREFVKDLRRGLDSLGLLRICDAFPTFRNLFTPIDQPKLTLKKMTLLLKPKMSPEGSNKHKQEMKVMKNFLAYLKEVSAGRRNNGNVTLAKVLRFVTAEEQEPPLGYEMNPSIEFKVMPSWYPTASSCGNILFLTAYGEMPERQRMFEIFDMAFDTPQHFGLT